MSKRILWLVTISLVFTLGFIGQRAMAQYTGEFIICTDGSSAETCRATALPVDKDGVVTWGRDLGSQMCAGVGIVPQKTDCYFLGATYDGYGCLTRPFNFAAGVAAGDDMAVACGTVSPLDNGHYSANAYASTCFDDVSPCQNWILTDFAGGQAE